MVRSSSRIQGLLGGFSLEEWLARLPERHSAASSWPLPGSIPASHDASSPATPGRNGEELGSDPAPSAALPAVVQDPAGGAESVDIGVPGPEPASVSSLRRSVVTSDAWVVALGFADDAPPPLPSSGPTSREGGGGGRILVQWDADATETERSAALAAVGGSRLERIHTAVMKARGEGVLEVIQLAAASSLEAGLATYRNTALVHFAEVDQFIQPQLVSNDPSYSNGSLWGMYSGDTPAAIGPNGTTNAFGSQAEAAWNRDLTGTKSVFVGVIDEGIDYTHPDLAANSWLNPFEAVDGIDNDGNGYIDDVRGWDFFNNDNSTYDGSTDDHGTHVAGTIGAAGGNGIGVAGVNWNVSMISVKFLGATGGYLSGAVQALDYLTDLKQRHGLNIVASNNSWGGGGYFESLHNAIIRSAKQDILFVAAAGNSASNNDLTPVSPANYNTLTASSSASAASYDGVISVASITNNGSLSSFSNFGATSVDLGAPGSSIVSTLPGGSYGSYSGTSMATPHVTGAVALYAASRPGSTAAQIRSALLASTTPTASLAGRTATGGRLNVEAFLGPSPSYSITAIQGPLAEGQSGSTPFQFRINRSANTSFLSKISWIVAGSGSSPANGLDFVGGILPSGEVSFATNETVKTISINVAADSSSEPTETFSVSLSAATADAVISTASAIGTILNDDAPITTAAITGVSDDIGSLRGEVVEGGRTDDATPTLSGTLSAALNSGENLRVLAGTTFLGTASVNNTEKTWSFTQPNALVSATYSFSVSVADASGNAGPASAPRTLTVDTLAPTLAISSDKAFLKAGETATLTFSFSEDPGSSFAWNGTSGDVLVAGGSLSALSGSGSSYSATFTPTPNSSGTASITVAAGSYNDAAGNPGGAGTSPALTYDTLAPTLSAIAYGPQDGNLAIGETIRLLLSFDEVVALSGSPSLALNTGGTATYTSGDGTNLLTFSYTPAAGENSADLATATRDALTGTISDAAGNPVAAHFFNDVNPPGLVAIDTTPPALTISSSASALRAGETATLTFSFSEVPSGFSAAAISSSGGNLSGLAETADPTVYTATFLPTANSSGTASITVAAASYTDVAGNPGGASNTATLSYDTRLGAIPTITEVSDNVGALQGSLAEGAVTDDTTPTLSGTLSSALAGGETLRVFQNATLLGTATVNSTARTWTFTPATALPAGAYSFSVAVADTAGTLAARSSARSLTIDTRTPSSTATITTVMDNVGLIQGAVLPSSLTDDATPTISGTLSAPLASGESLLLYNGSTLLGAATVSNQSWSFTPTLRATLGTTYAITARVASAIGALGRASSSRSFTLDTTAPTTTTTITSATDNFGPIQGEIPQAAVTDDTTPTLSGTASRALASSETLRVFQNSALIGAATVSNNARTWTFTPATALPSGAYSFSVAVADAAGNLAALSSVRSLSVDTGAPSPTALTWYGGLNSTSTQNPWTLG
jgi:subtilisin family serine protease